VGIERAGVGETGAIQDERFSLEDRRTNTRFRDRRVGLSLPSLRVNEILKTLPFMVDDVRKAQNAVTFAKYPPIGKRSQGGGQYGRIWGRDYRQTINENIMIVAMIESPAGVAIADKVAAVSGVDVVFVASSDLSSFTGYQRDDPRYMKLVNEIKDKTLAAGKYLAGPAAWRDREGYLFFQGPSESSLISSGAKLELAPAQDRKDVATGDEAR